MENISKEELDFIDPIERNLSAYERKKKMMMLFRKISISDFELAGSRIPIEECEVLFSGESKDVSSCICELLQTPQLQLAEKVTCNEGCIIIKWVPSVKEKLVELF